MTARAREVAAVLLCLALAACTPSTSDPASGPEQGRSSDGWTLTRPLSAGWAAFDEFTSGQVITPTGQGAVYWGSQSAHGIAVATGEFAWHTDLPGVVCGASPVPNNVGQIAVMTGSSSLNCRKVSLLDSSDGSTLWTVKIPRNLVFSPSAVSTGENVVVLTAPLCGGYFALDLDDGAVNHEYVADSNTDDCISAASDAETIVLTENNEFRVLDATTGKQVQPPLPGPRTMLSAIVSREPLVVSGQVTDSRRPRAGSLLAVGPHRIRVFGRESLATTGRPTRYLTVDDTLWLGYKDDPRLPMRPNRTFPKDTFPFWANPIGYDLHTHKEIGAVDSASGLSSGKGTQLVGSIGTDVVLAVDGEIRIGPARDTDTFETVATAAFDDVVVGDWVVGIDGANLRATRLPTG